MKSNNINDNARLILLLRMRATITVDRQNRINGKFITHADRQVANMQASPNIQSYMLQKYSKTHLLPIYFRTHAASPICRATEIRCFGKLSTL